MLVLQKTLLEISPNIENSQITQTQKAMNSLISSGSGIWAVKESGQPDQSFHHLSNRPRRRVKLAADKKIGKSSRYLMRYSFLQNSYRILDRMSLEFFQTQVILGILEIF